MWIYPKSEASQPKEEVKKIVSTGVKKNFFENCWDFLLTCFLEIKEEINETDQIIIIQFFLFNRSLFVLRFIIF